MNNLNLRTGMFLGAAGAVAVIAIALVFSTVIFTRETFWISIFWILGFGFLIFNVSLLLVQTIVFFFVKTPILEECAIKDFPKVAMVYPVRNEEHGLYERIDYSLSGNILPNLDLWILSDSSAEFESFERNVFEKLKGKYGQRIHYRRRAVPIERKQGNLNEFLTSHPEYEYLYVCDADSMVPYGAVLKLLRKAIHPQNQNIAIFQCFVRITHAQTWYATFEKYSADSSQRFSFSILQSIFGRVISFGHHHLVRAKLLSQIDLPKGLLSHDNWDTALLDQMGYRVVFCPDVIGYDEAPSNYLEARARSKRWSQGTLQGWPLIFMPRISLASRFLATYGIYLYLSDLVFFCWVILGVIVHSAPFGQLIYFQIDSIWLGLYTNSILKFILIFSLGIIFFHKAVVIRSARDFRRYLYELVFSTLITLNNFFYVPLDILTLPLRKLVWRPMSKNPFANLTFVESFKNLWLGTAFGIFGFYFCTFETPYFVWQATSILTSLVLSVPVVYATSKPVPHLVSQWI